MWSKLADFLALIRGEGLSKTQTDYTPYFCTVLVLGIVLLYLYQYIWRDSPQRNSGIDWWCNASAATGFMFFFGIVFGWFILISEHQPPGISMGYFIGLSVIVSVAFLMFYFVITLLLFKVLKRIPFSTHNRRTTGLGVN